MFMLSPDNVNQQFIGDVKVLNEKYFKNHIDKNDRLIERGVKI